MRYFMSKKWVTANAKKKQAIEASKANVVEAEELVFKSSIESSPLRTKRKRKASNIEPSKNVEADPKEKYVAVV